jgi:hypothetical protein
MTAGRVDSFTDFQVIHIYLTGNGTRAGQAINLAAYSSKILMFDQFPQT